MDTKSLDEIQNNGIVRKRLAKLLAHDCFRNTVLEDFHARGKLNDEEIKALMIDVVNHTYRFLNRLSGTEGDHIVGVLKEKDFDSVSRWNDPE